VEALQAGDHDTAAPALREAIALVPGHVGAQGPHRALVRLERERGAREATAAALRALVSQDADDLGALVELADELEALGDARGAADALSRALLVQPFDPSLHRRLAQHLEADGQWAAARTARAAVVALDPADPVQARYRLALAASRAGDPAAARREILAALENAPLFEDGLELLLRVREQLDAPRGAAGGDGARR
jgi:predicted Zn-dependent protease